ncbi:UDPglucose--hexose-1-phosphate uridylyltransferase [Saonia flava]|uniref:Galactose-1-phosphate uridylyltransferase n=1 Tax=Saonia flava TaxID=523696 RepID=A0A846R593_9FLAO|nr:UDP-glucose--hexose-1-phosphate uridylyltransferase [Saonia flava]NJB71949.1 UDPglucose--hexose-1-phosphate uridylyltransferase [Saonia flava]
MKTDINTVPHRRYNILTGEWILVSPQRTKRPWQGKRDKNIVLPQVVYDENCYLCPGNTRASGPKNANYDSTYSFTNDFSAILPEIESSTVENGFLIAKTETGKCKVICFSPNHSLTLPIMSIKEIAAVVRLWIQEYFSLAMDPTINHVQIFENKGATMGCSNPHPHGQIWSQSSIPTEVLKKQQNQKKYWNTHNKSLLQDYINQELDLDKRIIYTNEHFVVLAPYWAIWPYETMIVPKKHYAHIGCLNNEEQIAFAESIKVITTKYDNLFETSFPYSAGIHQSPTDGTNHDEWHFHMSFYPPLLRSAEVKKFMVGYEMFADPQRDITVEQAVETLKKLPVEHYSLSTKSNTLLQ